MTLQHPYDTPAPNLLGELPYMPFCLTKWPTLSANDWIFLMKVWKSIDFSKKCPGNINAEGSEDKLLPIDATY